MNDIKETEWTDEQARSLRALGYEGNSLPPALKPALVRTLFDLGLLSPPGRRRGFFRSPWAAAAVFALIGFGVGRALPFERRAGVSGGPRFVLLLTGAESPTPEQNYERRREYGDWLASIQNLGVIADGAELVGLRHELPRPGRNEPVVGYFIINVGDESQALAIAKANPHLRHGGGITVAALR